MEQQTCCYVSRGEQGEVCQDGVDGDEELTYLVLHTCDARKGAGFGARPARLSEFCYALCRSIRGPPACKNLTRQTVRYQKLLNLVTLL